MAFTFGNFWLISKGQVALMFFKSRFNIFLKWIVSTSQPQKLKKKKTLYTIEV